MVVFTLRPASRDDLPALYPFYRAGYRHYYDDWDDAIETRRFFEGFPVERAMVILVHGDIAGAVDMEHRDDGWHLNNIEIAPEHQSQGIGTAVVRDLLGRAARDGCDARLECLKVNRAIGLYERLGFEIEGETETHFLMRAGQ